MTETNEPVSESNTEDLYESTNELANEPTNELVIEDRYESLDMIIKVRPDGKSWFDIISDLVSEDCGVGTDPEENICTCGLESMGGTVGTLDQCYRHVGIADDLAGPVSKADLILILDFFARSSHLKTLDEHEAAKRLRTECTWWDEVLAYNSDEDVVTFETPDSDSVTFSEEYFDGEDGDFGTFETREETPNYSIVYNIRDLEHEHSSGFHVHAWSDTPHSHMLRAVCNRPECSNFNTHNIHPSPSEWLDTEQ